MGFSAYGILSGIFFGIFKNIFLETKIKVESKFA